MNDYCVFDANQRTISQSSVRMFRSDLVVFIFLSSKSLSLSFVFSMRPTDSNSDLFFLFSCHSMLIWYFVRNPNYVEIQFRNNKRRTYLHFCGLADLRFARYHITVSNNKPIGRSVSFLRASCMVSNLPSYGKVRYG